MRSTYYSIKILIYQLDLWELSQRTGTKIQTKILSWYPIIIHSLSVFYCFIYVIFVIVIPTPCKIQTKSLIYFVRLFMSYEELEALAGLLRDNSLWECKFKRPSRVTTNSDHIRAYEILFWRHFLWGSFGFFLVRLFGENFGVGFFLAKFHGFK